MLKLIKTEYMKLRHSKILYIAIFGVFITSFIILLFSQNINDIGHTYSETPGWILGEALLTGSFYILPTLFSLIADYTICREYDDDTMKNLKIIPVNIEHLIKSKLLVSFFIAVFLFLILFIIELTTETILHKNAITNLLILKYFKQYFLQGIGLFLAVTPIIAVVALLHKGHWISLVFSVIYSFAGVFISQSNMLRCIYPITVSCCFSGFSPVSTKQYIISCVSLLVSLLLSLVILKFAQSNTDN